MKSNVNLTANQAWEKILEKYDIKRRVEEDGYFFIKASEIKKYKEPRLMAKWDSSETLPNILEINKLNILPNSRNSYVISDFLLYEPIPELDENVERMDRIHIPELESININNINSEANAINVLVLSNILDDFLETDENLSTFNGRMGTGEFKFTVDSYSGVKRNVCVKNAQCEIDGGFENSNSVVIMEAKNVVYSDFHIRQLYYPYRLWEHKVQKPVRLVFSIYSNKIYRLFEYEFELLESYSSIKLLKTKNYSLQDTEISLSDLEAVRSLTTVRTDDNKASGTPFIQADSFHRIISLLENLYDNPMTEFEVAELMQFETRQSSYYFNAGKYLGLFEKDKENGQIFIKLTSIGNKVFRMNYKERQLKLVSLILEHQIFSELFDYVVDSGEFPEREIIIALMIKYDVCNIPQIDRRSSSVACWLKWIFNLTKI